MKTKSCRKCSPQGKRCDCPTESESEKAALGPWEVIDRIRCERDEIRAQLREEQRLHVQTLNERDEANAKLDLARARTDGAIQQTKGLIEFYRKQKP